MWTFPLHFYLSNVHSTLDGLQIFEEKRFPCFSLCDIAPKNESCLIFQFLDMCILNVGRWGANCAFAVSVRLNLSRAKILPPSLTSNSF